MGKLSLTKSEVFLFLVFIVFSTLLMLKTFGITPEGDLRIAIKAWSDFAATIPLIRSFSNGSNFPPEYPIFAGPPIRYHFVFYFLVGMLEKIGLPLSWALNSLSIFGFSFLLIIIYIFAREIFKSKTVGFLSVIFFLFNGSFAFVEFFKKYPISFNSLKQIVTNIDFSSFGPYDGKIVSAFWNLNIFTNQRHLALAYAIFLLVLLFISYCASNPDKFSFKKSFVLGLTIGLFPFIHYAVFGMIGIMLLLAFLIYPKIRLQLFVAGGLALSLAIPQIIYMGKSNLTTELIRVGYLINNPTLYSFLNYWLVNLGLVSILSFVGFLLASKEQKKVFIPFFVLFIFGNIFQVSSEIAANHKFFNLYLICANMFMAYALTKIWMLKVVGKIAVILVFPVLILSGIIDLFPIFNDNYITIEDTPNNKMVEFIKEYTPKDSVILNGSYLYDPANLAGRKIYLGWPYFSWSAGYDTSTRFNTMKEVLESPDKSSVCRLLTNEKIDYIEIQNPTPIEGLDINYKFFEDNFTKIFTDRNTVLYEVDTACND